MKKKVFNKKGMEMSIIKYLFGMLAGALILIFFFSFAMKHKGISENLESNQLVFSFDDALTAFGASGDSNKEYLFTQPTELIFSEGTVSSKGSVAKKTEKVVFSRERVVGKKLLAWTKRWKFVFSVENFFYLTNDRVKIYLVYNSKDSSQDSESFVKDLLEGGESVPTRFHIEAIDYNNLNQKKAVDDLKKMLGNFDEIRFVFFSNPGKLVISLPEKLGKVYLMRVDPKDNGKIIFLSENSSEGIYLGKEMMWGAIFSGNAGIYEFNVKRALGRLGDVSGIYAQKTNFLTAKTPPECDNYYNGIKSNLAGLKALAESQELEDVAPYVEFEEALKRNVEDLSAECPEVF
ncbi:hypothetical protein HY643_05390 [Candidatus Woesearchaeota archaeon]|nr:hypothetical protein [Candidatus Woesearchaeota archaeon]